MVRRSLLVAAVAALSLVPVAVADGGGPPAGTTQGYDGVVNNAGTLRFVSVPVPESNSTVIEAVQTSNGRVVQFASVLGPFGVPVVSQDGQAGGLSADGKTLVLADGDYPQTGFRTASHFAVFEARALGGASQQIVLAGDYAYDALSPDGRTLLLIQHVSAQDTTRYVVRAYDLERGRLLPQKIADRTQKGWVMQGYPMTRATSADGRFVYTLYTNPAGYPFVHALDTVTRTAHCVGVPWASGTDQGALGNIRLSLQSGGKQLALLWRTGTPYVGIDTRTYRVSRLHDAFPWGAVVGGLLGGVALLLAGALVVRRRRRAAPLGEWEAFLREMKTPDRVRVGAADE